ncbi:hypothetical protein DSO57_1028666 [Entomophthora muscae]|uniref:Uncharacterized protein n=1 Tax=Entomophthora muscae TaxID=34485 RepID=A0ACC2S3H1_9FUNG|nr:hypothetical protein DSO57_1028666 [Entomophthora muscae]
MNSKTNAEAGQLQTVGHTANLQASVNQPPAMHYLHLHLRAPTGPPTLIPAGLGPTALSVTSRATLSFQIWDNSLIENPKKKFPKIAPKPRVLPK